MERGKKGQLQSKSRGAGLMVAAYLTEVFGGVLHNPVTGEIAATTLEYGGGRWWTSAKMMLDLKRVVEIRKQVLPFVNVVWRFDWSTCHSAKGESALNEHTMNVGPGGEQRFMRSTTVLDAGSLLYNQVQHMVFQAGDINWYSKKGQGEPIHPSLVGKQKGLVQVLSERWGPELAAGMTGKNRKKLLAARLGQDLDFMQQTTLIHEYIRQQCPHDIVRFYPKYHCEFPAIERFWSAHKRYCRLWCKYNIVGLRKVVPQGLDSVCEEEVRRYFGICRRYEVAYRQQVSTTDIVSVVQTYTSHRRVTDTKNVVVTMLAEGKLQESEFRGLCSCLECITKDPNMSSGLNFCSSADLAPRCAQPRCKEHASYKDRVGEEAVKMMNDDEVESRLKCYKPGHVAVEEVAFGEDCETVEIVNDGDSDVDDDESDQEEQAVACCRRNCRRWRDVPVGLVAAKALDYLSAHVDGEYLFTCSDAGMRCSTTCKHCEEIRGNGCTCTCNVCNRVGTSCVCPFKL